MKFSSQEQQKWKICGYLPTIFVAVPQEIPPQLIRPLKSQKLAILTYSNTGSIHPKPLEGPIAFPKGTQKIIHYYYFIVNAAAYILRWIQQGSRYMWTNEITRMPEAEFLWKVNRLGTAICFRQRYIPMPHACLKHYFHFEELFSWSQNPTSTIWDFGSSLFVIFCFFL